MIFCGKEYMIGSPNFVGLRHLYTWWNHNHSINNKKKDAEHDTYNIKVQNSGERELL